MNSAVAERAKLYPSPALLSAPNRQSDATVQAAENLDSHGQPEKLAKIEIRLAVRIPHLAGRLDGFRRHRRSHKG
jgi:hypothetical protein